MGEYLNLKGTLSLPTEIKGSIDVSQNATATEEDIKKGKTAVVKGKPIEGTFEESEHTDISLGTTATTNDIRQGKTAAVNGEVIEGIYEPPKIEDRIEGYEVTFGSEMPTYGCKVHISKLVGSPYVSIFKNGRLDPLVSLEVVDDGITINEDGLIEWFRITDSTGLELAESLEQARTRVRVAYITE